MATSSEHAPDPGQSRYERLLARTQEKAAEAAAAKRPVEEVITCPRHGPFRPIYTYACTRCEDEAREAGALESSLTRCHLIGRFRETTFASYHASTADQRRALTAVREWADSVTSTSTASLFLIGTPGVGKTHLAAAAVRHLRVDRGIQAALYSAREIVREIRATWDRAADSTEEQVIKRFGTMAVLAIDEVGGALNTDSERVLLFDVIDQRYQLRRPTLLASNLALPEIKAAVGERAFDRLREGARVVPMHWASYRGNHE